MIFMSTFAPKAKLSDGIIYNKNTILQYKIQLENALSVKSNVNF